MSPFSPRKQTSLTPLLLSILMACVVVAICSHIPIPGLNMSAVGASFYALTEQGMTRVSIYALGILPLFVALANVEIFKLAFPKLAQPTFAFGRRLAIAVLALLLTLAQGYGIARALIAMHMLEDSTSVILACLSSFAGVTGLLIWLTGLVRLPKLDHGIWVLMTLPALAALPTAIAQTATWLREGMIMPSELILGLAATLTASALIVIAYQLLANATRQDEPGRNMAVLLWPPILANTVAGYLLTLLMQVAPYLLVSAPWLMNTFSLIVGVLLTPLFVYAYARRERQAETTSGARALQPRVLMVVALVQVTVCAGLSLMSSAAYTPLLPHGETLIVYLTVMLAALQLLKAQKTQP